MMLKKALLLTAHLAFLPLFISYSGMEAGLASGVALLLVIASLWLSEVLSLSVTALLVPVLAVLLGISDLKSALSHFAHPIIFLFLGGFALATALREQKLDVLLAHKVLSVTHGRLLPAAIGVFAVTFFLSMWISNTAATAMMLPLALSLLSDIEYEEHRPAYWFLLLGMAYSASIGGMTTLVGSPPNAIVGAALALDFATWLKLALPVVAVVFPAMLVVLWLMMRPGNAAVSGGQFEAISWDRKKYMTLAVFVLTALSWLFSKPLAGLLGVTSSMDSLIALAAIVVLHALGLMPWRSLQKQADWGVLLLFGGGLALSQILKDTGVGAYFADTLVQWFNQSPELLVLLAVAVFVAFLTEMTSNTASAAILVPIFMAAAPSLGVSVQAVAVITGLAASCAFMLPVATPPNAIVYGSSYVPQSLMVRVGFGLNLMAAGFIASMVYLLSA